MHEENEEEREDDSEDGELYVNEENVYDDSEKGNNSHHVEDVQFCKCCEGIRVSDIDFELECKEIELGEYQIENEQQKQTLDKCERKNESLVDRINLLENENALLKAMLSQCQWQGFSTHQAIVSLRSNNEVLQSKLERQHFGASSIKDNDSKTCFYTGLATYQLFLSLFLHLKDRFKSTVTRHQLIDEFFVTLVKLHLGVPHKDLAYRLDVSEKSIGYIFRRWIDVMSVELQFLIVWPEKEALVRNMPKTFKKHIIKTRCIIDCFEIFIQHPTSFVARAQIYSQYIKNIILQKF